MTTLYPVDIANANRLWGAAQPFIEAAIAHQDLITYNVHHVQHYVTSGQWLLILGVRDQKVVGAATVSFVNYPLHRVAVVTALGGRGVVGKDTLAQLRDICKTYGATAIQSQARGSAARLYRRAGLSVGTVSVSCAVE